MGGKRREGGGGGVGGTGPTAGKPHTLPLSSHSHIPILSPINLPTLYFLSSPIKSTIPALVTRLVLKFMALLDKITHCTVLIFN